MVELSRQAKKNAIEAQEYAAIISASARRRLAHAIAQGDTWHHDWFESACGQVRDEQETSYQFYALSRYVRDYDE